MPERYSMIVKKFSSQSLRRRCVVGAVARFEDVDGNDDAACTDADETSTTVDSANDVGSYSSITIGVDGNPVISHRDSTSGDLRVTACNDAACTGADETSTTVDSAGLVGTYTSITIGFDGNPVIAHHDFASGDLRVTHLSRRSWTENVWEQ